MAYLFLLDASFNTIHPLALPSRFGSPFLLVHRFPSLTGLIDEPFTTCHFVFSHLEQLIFHLGQGSRLSCSVRISPEPNHLVDRIASLAASRMEGASFPDSFIPLDLANPTPDTASHLSRLPQRHRQAQALDNEASVSPQTPYMFWATPQFNPRSSQNGPGLDVDCPLSRSQSNTGFPTVSATDPLMVGPSSTFTKGIVFPSRLCRLTVV